MLKISISNISELTCSTTTSWIDVCYASIVVKSYIACGELKEKDRSGPFQGHVCDQKKWKLSLLNGYSSWYKCAINKFLIDNNLHVGVKTFRSLKIKFFVKVKNKVYVTIGYVCDFTRNCDPASNGFKIKIL